MFIISAYIFDSYSNFLFTSIFLLLKVIILQKSPQKTKTKTRSKTNKKRSVNDNSKHKEAGSFKESKQQKRIYKWSRSSLFATKEMSQNESYFIDQFTCGENKLLPFLKFLILFEVAN